MLGVPGGGGSDDLPGHRAGAHACLRFAAPSHPYSFGFRPGRSAHHGVERARQFIADDAAWCVDFDLDQFFDRVQHDALMARVARRVHDRQVLWLVRRYVEAGGIADAIVHASEEGTPQRSPLSPLLSNVILDDLDWELDRRGHRFVCYADDVTVYVASERAGQRVMASISQYVEQRLKLRVNRQKSAVAPAVERPLLGFQFFRDGAGEVTATVAPKASNEPRTGSGSRPRATGASRYSAGSWSSTASRSDGPVTSI